MSESKGKESEKSGSGAILRAAADEWRDIAMLLHEAYTAGVGVEVLEMYTSAIRRGESAREAALWACDEWDAVPTWWRWEADGE